MLRDCASLKLGFLVGWEAQDSYHKTWEWNTWKEEGREMGGWGWDEGSPSSSCVSHQ